MNTESMISLPVMTSSAVMSFAFFLPTSSPKRADALGQRGAEALLVGAAVGGRDGVAVIAFAPSRLQRPGDRPFGAALHRRPAGNPGVPVKGWLVTVAVGDLLGEMVGEAAGELEDRFRGRSSLASDGAQRQRISTPAKR